jgi:hypothetical protein
VSVPRICTRCEISWEEHDSPCSVNIELAELRAEVEGLRRRLALAGLPPDYRPVEAFYGVAESEMRAAFEKSWTARNKGRVVAVIYAVREPEEAKEAPK